MHTHTEGDRDWLRDLAIAYVHGAEPKCKVFHHLSIRLNMKIGSFHIGQICKLPKSFCIFTIIG